MDPSVNKRTRILLHFSLGIGLPSLLLGYLAFRGIQNDQALLEKERLRQQREVAKLITGSVDEAILTVEKRFLDITAKDEELSGSDFLDSLEDLKNRQPLVGEIFFLESSGAIQLPIARLLFVPDKSIPSAPGAAQSSPWLEAERHEFQENSYPAALTNYQEVFSQATDDQMKAEALNAIARVQQKSGQLQDAIESYRTIVEDYNQIRTANGVPLDLAARLELASLYRSGNDTLNAAKVALELFEHLVHQKWTVEKAQYEFFSQRSKASVAKILSQAVSPTAQIQSYRNTFTQLEREESSKKETTEKLLAFQTNAAGQLAAEAPRSQNNSHSDFRRSALEIDGRIYLVSLLAEKTGDGDQRDGIWGLLLNAVGLKTELLGQVMQQYASSGDFQWVIRGNNGEVVSKSAGDPAGSPTFRQSFAGNFPPWSLEFYQPEQPLYETLLTSRRGIYFYAFVLLAGILIFGLTLTIRSVTRELELARMKSDFVSTISHEFKSPLTSIRQLAEMLQRGRAPSHERRQQYYDVLLEQSERLTLLIDNILDFSRMEEGRKQFEFETVDMGALVQEIASAFQQRVAHGGFTVQAEVAGPLRAIQVDRSAITQVINNLIDNAVKYSAESRKVNVKVFGDDQYLTVAVEDFGIGIRKEELDQVFDRFYRGGDELTRTVRGTGLGLTLVKQIVEAHKGAMQVESEPGKGSTFSIRLPLDRQNDA